MTVGYPHGVVEQNAHSSIIKPRSWLRSSRTGTTSHLIQLHQGLPTLLRRIALTDK
jgi:hypothetical protein